MSAADWQHSVFLVQCADIDSKGTCFAVSEEGFLVTNNHVVAKLEFVDGVLQVSYSESIAVNVGGTLYPARLLTDKNKMEPIVFDYAFLEFDPGISIRPLDVSGLDSIEVGEEVVCLGYPLDFEQCVVTRGIVSSVLRRPSHWNTLHQMDTVLTDALVQFGNSGGPMIRTRTGQVVAINTLKHELRDVLGQRLDVWREHPALAEAEALRELITFTLKYTHIGLSHGVAMDHAKADPMWPK